jgi:hypothetical protein
MVLAALALACALGTGAAQAQPDLKAAADTVLAQLEAFRRDDYDTAYTFASEGIRRIFDRARFEQMVKTGYPEIARSQSAAVERAVLADGQAYLVLKILGANGNRIEAIYEMVWEDNRWRIGGVVSRQDNDVV